MKVFIKIISVLVLTITLSGCAQVFNCLLLKNQCKKCDLIDRYNGEVVYSVEGCGTQNTDLHGKCEKAAWDISRGRHLCDFDIKCKTWKREK